MFETKSPISYVVAGVAAAVAKSWDEARAQQLLPRDEEESAFLAIAYQYLSKRERAVYSLERTRHLDEARWRYKPPPSATELYGEIGQSEDSTSDIVITILVAALSVAGAAAASAVVLWLLLNAPLIIAEILRFLQSKEAATLALSTVLPMVFLIAIQYFVEPLIRRHLLEPLIRKYVPVGPLAEDWRLFQPYSTKQIESERAQIVAMMDASPEMASGAPRELDSDVAEADAHPAPIQPGVTEFVLSTGRLTVKDLGNDFQRERTRHDVVFWVTFGIFIASVVCGLMATFVWKEDIKFIGSIGIFSGVIGTFSFKMLNRSRTARIALTLFNSYVIELQESWEELAQIPDLRARKKARSAAWTAFRSGLNHLYNLEEKSDGKTRWSPWGAKNQDHHRDADDSEF